MSSRDPDPPIDDVFIVRPARAVPFVAAGIAAHAVLVLLGATTNPGAWATGLFTCLGFGLSLPFSMAFALGAAALVLTLVLGGIAMLARPFGPTGVREVIRDAWRLPGPIVPAYFNLLRGVRSPALWGFVAGAATATCDLAVRASTVA